MQKSDGIYPGFVFTGYYGYGTGLVSSTGNGYYWSRTVHRANYSDHLYLYSSSVYPQNSNVKGSGFAVRCVSAY